MSATSALPLVSVRVAPLRIASSGRRGVESSLNISIFPRRRMMKSVNVPPVSIPILKIGLRDILDESRDNRLNFLDRSLRVALPCERLNIWTNGIKPVDGDFPHPGEILISWCVGSDVFDPLQYLLPLRFVGPNLQHGAFAGIDPQLNLMPPPRFNHAKVEHCLQDINGRKITA